MRKGFCALLMILCLVLALVPAASAEPEAVAKAIVGGAEKEYNNLPAAVEAADQNTTVYLCQDTTITASLAIYKKITLDLGGNVLSIRTGWGGINAYSGCSIQNGTIDYVGNVAAIRVFDVELLDNLAIQVKAKDAGRVTGGVVVQEGTASHLGTIRNTVINGPVNGIETHKCGHAPAPVIGLLENVTIDATRAALWISAPCGTAKNCSFTGNEYGIDMYLTNVWSATLTLEDCDVTGGDTAVHFYDEWGNKKNPGKIELEVDDKSTFTSAEGKPALKADVEEEEKYEPEDVFGEMSGICAQTNADGSISYFAEHSYNADGLCTVCGHSNVVAKAPQTGDNSQLALWSAMLILSGMVMLHMSRKEKYGR